MNSSKKCGHSTENGKKCKRDVQSGKNVCWQHDPSHVSPKKSPLNLNNIEDLPAEIIEEILLKIPRERINAFCRANPRGKIAAVCANQNFQNRWKKLHPAEYRQTINGVNRIIYNPVLHSHNVGGKTFSVLKGKNKDGKSRSIFITTEEARKWVRHL